MQNNNSLFNFAIDNVFNYKGNAEDIIPPIPLVNFVVDNADNKTVDNNGNYWVA